MDKNSKGRLNSGASAADLFDEDDVIFLSDDDVTSDEVFKRPKQVAASTTTKTTTVVAQQQQQDHQQQMNKVTFKDKTIEKLMKKAMADESTSSSFLKVNDSAVKVTGELLRIYTLELLTRAAEQAIREEDPHEASSAAAEVTTEHLEKVLAQFLLDFN